MVNILKIARQILKHKSSLKVCIVPDDNFRFVNWYLLHECDRSCSYCRVFEQKTGVMDRPLRRKALRRVRRLCARKALLSIIGGEPTLRPNLLVEAVEDAVREGFLVNIVTNGRGLTADLIKRLAMAGLHHLAISVDCHARAEKRDLTNAVRLLALGKDEGIVPVINTVLTRHSDIDDFKRFGDAIMGQGIFLSPLACSPSVPGGVFSGADRGSVPTMRQLRKVVPWLIWKKLSTGLVTGSFGYLLTLLRVGLTDWGETRLWHCSSTFRRSRMRRGRGFITLDSDGFVGPCQEFPRLVNILEISWNNVFLSFLDEMASRTVEKCPGCLHNCYIMEEAIAGIRTVAEIATVFRMANIKANHGSHVSVAT